MVRAKFSYTLRTGRIVKKYMEVDDARLLDVPPELDRNGAELRVEETHVIDFCDDASVVGSYYQECRRIIARKYPHAARIAILDHNIRHQTLAGQPLRPTCSLESQPDAPTYNPPVLIAHNDWSDVSAPQRLKELTTMRSDGCEYGGAGDADSFSEAELDELLRTCDYKFVNIWRNIGKEPIEDRHLAFIDGQTFDEHSVVRSDELHEDGVGAVCFCEPSTKHKWYFWDRMDPSEVMLLKCYDSHRGDRSSEGFCRFTVHSSFIDPTASVNVAPRQSIEVRMSVFIPRSGICPR
eukprot:TRINITY_DN73745_c0_g1_i1.p1 TRINITY_DN73745_c0_g1~~TRINITY_DN73745_c0_g1_i1.p1  ORF type:complete len:294 (-),score=34.44 TRINITY_DN73745_c0_g1_i1:36-917(-)